MRNYSREPWRQVQELQLQHPPVNDQVVLQAEHPILPEGEGMIEDDEPIQLSSLHSLGDMKNRCLHCGARYFMKSALPRASSPNALFMGKSLYHQFNSRHRMLWSYSVATQCSHVISLKTFATIMPQWLWHLGMQQ